MGCESTSEESPVPFVGWEVESFHSQKAKAERATKEADLPLLKVGGGWEGRSVVEGGFPQLSLSTRGRDLDRSHPPARHHSILCAMGKPSSISDDGDEEPEE